MIPKLTLLSAAAALCFLAPGAGLHAETPAVLTGAALEERLVPLKEQDAALAPSLENSPDCETGCITPAQALKLAFEAGEGKAHKGRFLLDIKGGGQSISGSLDQLFFVSSRLDYARFGTLTIAIEPDALYNILRRARVCNARNFRPGRIDVRGCRQDANFDLNMFTMIQRLGGKRIAVDGEAMLQWIDARTGLPRPEANKRGEHEQGYYQVWVKVRDADQMIFVHDE